MSSSIMIICKRDRERNLSRQRLKTGPSSGSSSWQRRHLLVLLVLASIMCATMVEGGSGYGFHQHADSGSSHTHRSGTFGPYCRYDYYESSDALATSKYYCSKGSISATSSTTLSAITYKGGDSAPSTSGMNNSIVTSGKDMNSCCYTKAQLYEKINGSYVSKSPSDYCFMSSFNSGASLSNGN